MAQQHFPVRSWVDWNERAYSVEEIKRRTDGVVWSLIKPADTDLQTHWVPNNELKAWTFPPRENKNFSEDGLTAGDIRARALIRMVLLHVVGFDSLEIPQEAIDAVTEYGEEQREHGLDAAAWDAQE